MNSITAAPSLYEDWLHRREELVEQNRLGSQHAKILLPVYEFLIRDYERDANARRPARFPRRAEFVVNERAIIVHRHLSQEVASGVKTTEAAESRVRSVLKRLVDDQHENESSRHDDDDSYFSDSHAEISKLAVGAAKSVKSGRRADKKIGRALDQSPYLPSELLNHLVQRIDISSPDDVDSDTALRMLLRCENRNLPNYVVRAWRNRILRNQYDQILHRFTQYLLDAANREAKLDRLRISLSDEDGRVRFSAIALLSQIGTLDDIGLLSDLLLLPPLTDELPNERQALTEAIQRIAKMTAV